MDARYQEYLKDREEALHEATPEKVVQYYEEKAKHYDNYMELLNSQSQNEIAKTAKEYCPGSPETAKILDVGSGTGLVGVKLQAVGFKYIDGVDPSASSIEVAKSRNVYNKLMCCHFTSKPLDILDGYYNIIVTNGAFLANHLPYDCLIEMVRLVRKGGIVCIASRASSFDGVTVPEYKKLLPLIEELETTGRLRKLKWNTNAPYIRDIEGILIVFEIL